MFVRTATHAYQDPLEQLWVHCANRLGFKVVRSTEAYASYDGKGRILIATSEQFDPDDNLAQMIFHELCHALVQGDEGEQQLDWGLDNTRIGNPWREHACLRAQAWLADQHGLRDFLAPTTDYRVTFWNSLGDDPLDAPEDEGGFRERSVVAARMAITRSHRPRWRQPLEYALSQTQKIAEILSKTISPTSGSQTLPSLWATYKDKPPPHPTGVAAVVAATRHQECRTCAWSFHYRSGLRCRHAPTIKLPLDSPACAAFEAQDRVDCLTCGACCREAYDSVEVGRNDPVRSLHPDMVIRQGGRLKLRRDQLRCAGLSGGATAKEPYHCRIYEGRPKTCRDFTQGGENCLAARRKVGLSL